MCVCEYVVKSKDWKQVRGEQESFITTPTTAKESHSLSINFYKPWSRVEKGAVNLLILLFMVFQ